MADILNFPGGKLSPTSVVSDALEHCTSNKVDCVIVITISTDRKLSIGMSTGPASDHAIMLRYAGWYIDKQVFES